MDNEELNIIGYHGTLAKNIESIESNGFKFDRFSLKDFGKMDIPCDLGNGVYTFIDNEDYKFEGIKCAKNYSKNRWYKENEFCVFNVHMSIDTITQEIVDLDDEEEIKYFMNFREKMTPILEELFKGRFHKTGAFKRGNCDGLILELLFKEIGTEPVLVIKSTFTKWSYYNQSSFPNGTEACIRDISIIKHKDICENFKRDQEG